MAIVPTSGRRFSPAGPVGSGGGPLYDAGLQALEAASGNLAGELAQRDLRLRAAYESAEMAERSANFALDLDDVTRRASELKLSDPSGQSLRMASADEQEEFFKGEISKLETKYSTWEKGLYGRKVSPEAKTRLHNTMVQETAQQQVRFRQVQQARLLQEMGDKFQNTLAAAIRLNSPALFQEAMGYADDAGISESVQDREAAEFPTNVRIEQLRRDAEKSPDSVMKEAMELQTLQDTTKKQRAMLREVEDLARGIRYDRKNAIDKNRSFLVNDAFEQAYKMDTQEFQDNLLKRDIPDEMFDGTDETPEQFRAQLMATFLNAKKLYDREGVNPFVTTQNHASLALAEQKVRDSVITSYKEIDEMRYADGAVQWSNADQRRIISQFDERNKPVDMKKFSRSHPMAKVYYDKVEELYDRGQGVIDAKRHNELIAALDGGLSEAGTFGFPDKMDAFWEGLTKDVKEKQAKGFIEKASYAMSFMPAPLFMPPDKAQQYNQMQRQDHPTGSDQIAANADIAARIARKTGILGQIEIVEPQSRDEFLTAVSRMKTANLQQAKEYYDKWAGKFQQ